MAGALASRPKAILIRKMQKPKAINQVQKKELAAEVTPLAWQEAWEQAVPKVQKRHQMGNEGIRRHLASHPMAASMQAMDTILQTWSLALELWHLS